MVKRNTIQRALVLQAVNRLQCHATAEEVYVAIAEEYANISKGTVYRNLNQLAESGQVLKIEVPNGADRFDHQCHEHYHARCLNCGRVFDVDMDYITNLQNAIKDCRGFEFSGHDIMFKGLCSECKA